MKIARRFLLVALVLSLLAAPSSSIVTAQDSGAYEYSLSLPQMASNVHENGIASYTVPLADQEAALEFASTIESRRSVQPLPWPVEENRSADWGLYTEPVGIPGSTPSGAPNPSADLEAAVAFADDWQQIEADQLNEAVAILEEMGEFDRDEPVEAEGTKTVFTSYQTNRYMDSWKQYPYRTVGKVYIKNAGYCSGAVISPKNVIVTAAHCVYKRGTGWYGGWTFVPAERNYTAPYGKWTAKDASVPTKWITDGGSQYDLAVIKLNTKTISGIARPVSYYTGYLGVSWNHTHNQSFFATGYPSKLSDGQKYTYTCAAEGFFHKSDVVGMGCNMTYGSSGGPWIRKYYPYRSGSVNLVNSVVSGHESPLVFGKSFIGPRFTDKNIVLLCNAIGGC